MDAYYGMDENLSATLSPGRSTTGYVSFCVPTDAEDIEIEYTTNYFTDDKIFFVYEGEQDSGYELPKDTTVTEGAFVVGDIVEAGDLIITYLSCEEYISDNPYLQPRDGYHYVSCEFEFENTGSSDKNISYFDFDGYADGINCDQCYIRDDSLSATISSGRKAKGTVTFEVPDDAVAVEAEYVSNYWTSSRIVFVCQTDYRVAGLTRCPAAHSARAGQIRGGMFPARVPAGGRPYTGRPPVLSSGPGCRTRSGKIIPHAGRKITGSLPYRRKSGNYYTSFCCFPAQIVTVSSARISSEAAPTMRFRVPSATIHLPTEPSADAWTGASTSQ